MPIILHADLLHVITNIISLFFVGFLVEKYMGKLKYTIFLVIGGIGGNIFSALCSPYSLSVGFSTSNFALLAACGWYMYLKYNKMGPQAYWFIGVFIFMVGFAFLNGFLMSQT